MARQRRPAAAAARPETKEKFKGLRRREGRLRGGAEEEGVRPLLNAWSAASPIPAPLCD